ncbi:Nitrogen permease regulator 2 [Coemansia erecta]|uniref:Nitrogen permease regulator 2 n=1 Tax=Coemansia erecta TaxID=147472 RepID=A0A9W8CR16_9FUNG|nr:Nitrogen permease regulator 2 [Coemansia erecta]
MSTAFEPGFAEIKAIFLAQFHPDLGPIVRLSYPEDAVELGEQKVFGEISSSRGDEHHYQHQKPGDIPVVIGDRNHGCHPNDAPVEMVQLIKRPSAARPASSSKIDFNSIQALVIPKLTLFERLITVNTGRYKVMCYPIAVEGNYARNALIFNMCFVFDIDSDTKCYEPVVKRVGCLLKELEISGRLLSDPEGVRPLRTMMRQLVSKLNAHGEYQIELDLKGLSQSMVSTGISIKLFPHYDNPTDIHLYDVPVRKMDFEIARLKSSTNDYQTRAVDEVHWDLVLDKVIHCMDNVNHVRRIARLAQIKEETVILALRHLDYYGCISLVDIFQFGNVYETSYRVVDAYRSAWMQRECHLYVTRNGKSGNITMNGLLQMYSTMRNRQTVAEWVIEQQINIEQFDVRRFVIFGVMHQLLRRVHCYPVICGPPSSRQERDDAGPEYEMEMEMAEESETDMSIKARMVMPADSGETLDRQILELLDGSHHLDEISVVSDRDIQTLKAMFGEYGGIEYMYR